ncbi:MAG TPA: hypothetical protein VJ505_09595 [Holophagaceae bacterium]|nr:hypothetical protein [Holophagaceae bacterium]
MRIQALALLLPTLVHPAQAQGARLHKGEAFAIIEGSTTISFGDGEAGQPGRYVGSGFWFRKDGKGYLVTDAALVAAAKAAAEPVSKLGAAQGKLGGEQGKLGAQQGRLGADQGRLGARMGGVAPSEREDLVNQMKALARQQEALGREQEALGRQQRDLGRQQEAASEAAIQKLRALRAEALAKGLAKAL